MQKKEEAKLAANQRRSSGRGSPPAEASSDAAPKPKRKRGPRKKKSDLRKDGIVKMQTTDEYSVFITDPTGHGNGLL